MNSNQKLTYAGAFLCCLLALGANAEAQTQHTAESTAVISHGMYVMTSNPGCRGASGVSSNDWSSCGVVTVQIPLTARIVSVTGSARERGAADWKQCVQRDNKDCDVGWARFDGNYSVQTVGGFQTISWTFKNWSHNRDREARVVVVWE